MPKRERLKLKRQELNLFDGDFERLEEILAPKKIPPGKFIRELVRRQIRYIETELERRISKQKAEPLNDRDITTIGLSPGPGDAKQPG